MAIISPPKIVHLHDKAFRNAMSDLRVARDFLSHYLPKPLLQQIDLETLALSKESYVDEELKLLVTDVLYSVTLQKHAPSLAYIYILCEHLSTPDRFTPWRMIRYISRIIDQQLKTNNNSHLPLVIPIVVYNGQVRYPYSTRLYDLFAEPEKKLAQEYMFQGFELIDFTQIPDEDMRCHQWSSILEILLKHAFSRDMMGYLESLVDHFRNLANQHAEGYLLGMLKYVIQFSNIEDKRRFKKFLQKSLPPPLEEKAMTTLAQLWIEEGFQKGIQQGIQKGIQQGVKKGVKQGEYSLLLRQLEIKFKTIPDNYRQRLLQADTQTLMQWAERVLDAHTLADIFETSR